MAQKARVLVVGTGGIGTMSAYALEQGGKAEVTAVMRSNYDAVVKNGINIDSVQYGEVKGWRPTHICNAVPNVAKENLPIFDFILVTTKNIPDVSPTMSDIIEPAVTPGKTAIVLSQNGFNIEKPIVASFPTNPAISSVSYCGSTVKSPGNNILHDDPDEQKVGPFHSPSVPAQVAEAAANRYLDIYNPHGRLEVIFDADVRRVRWRKLLYNASFNTVSTILRMDTPRMRQSRHVIDNLIRPIIEEILAAAAADGVTGFPQDVAEAVIRQDPLDTAFKPSMCQDIERGNLIELENIVGEPLREGEAKGAAMPTLRTVYSLLKGLQLQVKESKGLWEPKFTADNPYS